MFAQKKIWLATASALVLLSAPVMAQNSANVTVVKPDGPAEQVGEKIDNAAAATVNAAENTADATAEAVDNAADATADAAKDAAEATADAADDAADATVQAADNAADATAETMENAEAAVETETETTEVAEGTPVEGQIFEQSPDTFLASTLLDASVVNAADEKIGDVNDMVLKADGTVEGVVIGVGGFLGIGEKNVAIELASLSITEDEDGDMRFMLDATEEMLEAAPEFRDADDLENEAEQAQASANSGTMAPATAPSN
ncbi:PRC-barrel domain-containing protein [Acuticoccus kandeliae]|uniref:PRC-barrel domain-containing protein n=1 Tax=Acuticoccus kandeliae TaxID=2073160 RepID=UPI0013009562|nr:PRC-barrel domain-containing protein [Acuticoccus kandeliae]